MIAKRLVFLIPLALLAACTDNAPSNDSRSASGEVLDGTISDAMLPIDTVQSEPPLADPEAFAKAQSEAAEGEPAVEGEVEAAEGEAVEAPTEAPAAEAAD